jgi:hypothetical protein
MLISPIRYEQAGSILAKINPDEVLNKETRPVAGVVPEN